jgi:SAM-dependent methyltransferase
MALAAAKSPTDLFWDDRANQERDLAKVNIADTVQRDHELQFVFGLLEPSMRMVEIGCGNGYVTQLLRSRVAYIDAFDYAENMLERARQAYGETNNRFLHDSVLEPKRIGTGYDAGLCVRVLINLRDLEEQKRAVRNMAGMIRRGGRLILIEGFRDGFDVINTTRQTIGLAPANPAAINFYCYLSDLMPTILEHFQIERTWHSGLFDFLTRIVYPQLVGADKAMEPGGFHHKVEPIVRANTLPDLGIYARLRGFALVCK